MKTFQTLRRYAGINQSIAYTGHQRTDCHPGPVHSCHIQRPRHSGPGPDRHGKDTGISPASPAADPYRFVARTSPDCRSDPRTGKTDCRRRIITGTGSFCRCPQPDRR